MNKKRLGNVGVLDLRTTQAEALEHIEWIDNVGTVLVSEETEMLLPQLSIGNLGGAATVPKECKLVDGELSLNHTFFAAGNTVNNLVNGTVKINVDVTKGDLENGITFLAVNGLVLCPRDLIPVLQSRTEYIKGNLVSLEDNTRILIGRHEVNHTFCQTLNTPVNLILVGKVDMTELLSADDVHYIENLEIIGKLKIAEENLQLLGDKLVQSPTLHIGVTLPSGYTYIKQPLTLNAGALQRFNQAKLFTESRIIIEKDVTAEAFQQAVSHVRTRDYVICPEALQSTLLTISDVTGENLLTFSEELVMTEGKHTLTAAELKYRPQRFALLVEGKLEIADDVKPDEFFQRIESVYNFGKIVASDEICGILQTKLRTRKGSIQNLDSPEEQNLAIDPETYIVRNVGYFKL
jgi:hypothetical protein